ncbi:MAG TPA: peptidoglycan-binding protein, partial [Myxococcaceae bacterium]|nr:peptidoglycan-binding protein [Myxococcaceae bacterium]
LVPFLTVLGEHNVVVVDKGRADGVQVGNTFTVVRQGDPISPEAFLNPARAQNTRLPVEDVGSCMAIDVKDIATMCLLTRSLREIVYGDHVEMRIDSEKQPRAALR